MLIKYGPIFPDVYQNGLFSSQNLIAFVSNNLIIILIAITWSIFISTAYENICEAVYINRLEDYKNAGVPMFPVVRGVHESIKHNLLWVAHLIPFPFLLVGTLGWSFVIFATILGLAWVVYSVKGFKANDKQKWAKGNLRFSLVYLILLSLFMILIGV